VQNVPKSQPHDQLDAPVLAHLRRDFVALRSSQTIAEALAHLRSQDLGERVVYFYVVDADDKLVGVLPTRRLLMGAPEARIKDIMRRGVVSLPRTANLLLACELFVMHRLLAFPVVDDDGRLLGIIDVSLFTDEMFDLSERQSSDDVFQLIGVRLAQARTLTPWISFRKRFPWLMCNVAGGIGCALIAGLYEAFLDSVIVLVLFIPVVLALAESVGMQSMTLTLQSMHQQQIDWRFLVKAVGREFLTAGMLGAATGLVVGSTAYFWKSAALVAAAIGGTILLAVVTACLLGVILPAGVRAFRGDPKIAAGPIVLAMADMVTLLLYFNLAGMLLRG
jgi:magnesium transporter